MHSITININNDKLLDKVTWLLEHFKKDGLEIVNKEDMSDLKLIKATRNEEVVSFEEYLTNESLTNESLTNESLTNESLANDN